MDFENLVLRPNCLITRSDLVFIPGPRSLFFYENPFGFIPRFLYEHGYKVHVLSLPFRGVRFRRFALQKWLNSKSGETFHFIMDEVTYQELTDLIPAAQIKSITQIQTENDEKISAELPELGSAFTLSVPALGGLTVPLTYRLHQIFNRILGQKTPPYAVTFSKYNSVAFDRFLDHCVKLAENEIYA